MSGIKNILKHIWNNKLEYLLVCAIITQIGLTIESRVDTKRLNAEFREDFKKELKEELGLVYAQFINDQDEYAERLEKMLFHIQEIPRRVIGGNILEHYTLEIKEPPMTLNNPKNLSPPLEGFCVFATTSDNKGFYIYSPSKPDYPIGSVLTGWFVNSYLVTRSNNYGIEYPILMPTNLGRVQSSDDPINKK